MEQMITLEDLTGALQTLPREQTLELRSQFIPKACKLHFEKSPMKVIRANGQYLYDDNGAEYLDCVNCVAHVGHCNPSVVEAARTAMLQMGNVSLGMSDIAAEYVAKLKTTFPSQIDTFLFVTSGSEANDLAVQMARQFSGGYDVVSVERSFHGGLSETTKISPRQFSNQHKCPDWVHVLQCPDLYRGKHRSLDPEGSPEYTQAVDKYISDAKCVMDTAVAQKSRKLACFISEPLMSAAGVIVPPSKWLHSVYSTVRAHGGLAIADEAQSGLGRSGVSMWSYQIHDNLVPDIITIGKPLGNGHPMACIATRSEIASRLCRGGGYQDYACDLVSAAVGLAVFNEVRTNGLQLSARSVGEFLREGIRSLAMGHQNIGQVRGTGLMVGVEIVYNQDSCKPAKDIAERICYKMLSHFIIVANDGIYKNVLIFTPPMCFTCENAHRVVLALGKVLTEIEQGIDDDIPEAISGGPTLSLDDLIQFPERPGSSSSGIDSVHNLDQELTQDDLEEDGGYATSHSFASMD